MGNSDGMPVAFANLSFLVNVAAMADAAGTAFGPKTSAMSARA